MMKEKLQAEIKRVGALRNYLLQLQEDVYFKTTDDVTEFTVDNIKEYALSASEAKQLTLNKLEEAGASEAVKYDALDRFENGDISRFNLMDDLSLLRELTTLLLTLQKLDGK